MRHSRYRDFGMVNSDSETIGNHRIKLTLVLDDSVENSVIFLHKDGGQSEEEGTLVTARPRRVSELNMPNQTPPIPNASSFFIFSPTNR